MTAEFLPACNRTIIQEILNYLVVNKDAKDTFDGILEWWLPNDYANRRTEVQDTLDFLILKKWLIKQETLASQKIYGINHERFDEIKAFQAFLE